MEQGISANEKATVTAAGRDAISYSNCTLPQHHRIDIKSVLVAALTGLVIFQHFYLSGEIQDISNQLRESSGRVWVIDEDGKTIRPSDYVITPPYTGIDGP